MQSPLLVAGVVEGAGVNKRPRVDSNHQRVTDNVSNH